jgi:hypothetical protein
MKKAKQKQRKIQQLLRPRNLLATHPLLKKGGTHLRTDKRASRARLKAQQRAQKLQAADNNEN